MKIPNYSTLTAAALCFAAALHEEPYLSTRNARLFKNLIRSIILNMDHQTLTEVHNTPLTDRKFAHDLRNALSPILLYAQFLEESLAKLSLENETQMARLITESVKEMNTMIVERCGRRDADS